METKYDGEHVIMHKKGDQYKWFTRNGKDFTKVFEWLLYFIDLVRTLFRIMEETVVLSWQLVSTQLSDHHWRSVLLTVN